MKLEKKYFNNTHFCRNKRLEFACCAMAFPLLGVAEPPVAELEKLLNSSGSEATFYFGQSADADGDKLNFQLLITAAPDGAVEGEDYVVRPYFPHEDTPYLKKFSTRVPGEYTAKLIVSDGESSAEDSLDFTVGEEADVNSPIAEIDASEAFEQAKVIPRSVPTGIDLHHLYQGQVLNFSVHDAGTRDRNAPQLPLTFQWIVDGLPNDSRHTSLSNERQPNVQFTPDVPGDYSLILVASNGAAAGTANKRFTVIPDYRPFPVGSSCDNQVRVEKRRINLEAQTANAWSDSIAIPENASQLTLIKTSGTGSLVLSDKEPPKFGTAGIDCFKDVCYLPEVEAGDWFVGGVDRKGSVNITAELSFSVDDANCESSNSPPEAAEQSLELDSQQASLVFDLIVSDPDNDPLIVDLPQSTEQEGTLVLEQNGNGFKVTYTPAPGFIGTDKFEYTVSDGEFTVPGSVRIEVVGEEEPDDDDNDPPIVEGFRIEDLALRLDCDDDDVEIVVDEEGRFSLLTQPGFLEAKAGGDTGLQVDNKTCVIEYTIQLDDNVRFQNLAFDFAGSYALSQNAIVRATVQHREDFGPSQRTSFIRADGSSDDFQETAVFNAADLSDNAKGCGATLFMQTAIFLESIALPAQESAVISLDEPGGIGVGGIQVVPCNQ